jgi:hypothetical protein
LLRWAWNKAAFSQPASPPTAFARESISREPLPTTLPKEETLMAEQPEDSSTNEDRFARQDFYKSSPWSSAVAIIGIAVIVGLVYFFLK